MASVTARPLPMGIVRAQCAQSTMRPRRVWRAIRGPWQEVQSKRKSIAQISAAVVPAR